MEYKYKIDVANIEDTETIVKFQSKRIGIHVLPQKN